ncbi:MAG: GC-type dockerin domain-anchored protein [Planctomycetota bacterium]|nr:GC-type dockerin domain-anchored protein [Planctomycetota bacterium]
MTRSTFPHRCRRLALTALALAAGTAAPSALAQDNPVILQLFEMRWADMERRMPDVFAAGYGATWLPPVSLGGTAPTGNTTTVGYDPWDRFDLGRPGRETAYGTEAGFAATVAEFKRANVLVYVDAVLNHNGGRQTSDGFLANGGYPGFWIPRENPPRNKQPTDNWGDFHAGVAGGYLQSENPGGARYDRELGDLVALIDIAQESNHQFIRHPVAAGNPQNIPAGTTYNRPDPNNAARYPDLSLTPATFNNPATFRGTGGLNFTIHPFNTTNPLQGDPIADNATGLLMRWTQWMLDKHQIDGFRFDAIKHAPAWFWDNYIDAAMFNRRTTPDGRRVTPFSFGESVEGNQFTFDNFIRKQNNRNRQGDAFGNRDALDLAGAGALRDLLNGGGFGSWDNVLNAHLDVVDDANNLVQDGSLGIFHIYSHDNSYSGDGSALPGPGTLRQQAAVMNAYLLMRTGAVKIYHNALGIPRTSGFFPRRGIDMALGFNIAANAPDATVTNLVQLHNQLARGQFYQLNFTDGVNQSKADVLVFDRRQGSQASVLVGVNDRWDSGFDTRSVLTNFPPGTRLRELSGNANNPVVDAGNNIPEFLTVGPDQRILINVPRNRTGTTDHALGFVIYAPSIPSGTVTLSGATTALPPDPVSVPQFRRRLTSLPIVATNTFNIELNTTPGDPLDINTDNAAQFRINAGYQDFNGNGQIDFPHTAGISAGYENFRTLNIPAYNGSTAANGRYIQSIDTSLLPEGPNYLSVIAFRQRPAGTAPMFREWRVPFYVDRVDPVVNINAPARITSTSFQFNITTTDRTVNTVHLFLNVPPATDPRTLVTQFTAAPRRDRFEWFRTIGGMTHGFNEISVVTQEENTTLLRTGVQRVPIFVDLCPADFNDDGEIDFFDYLDFAAAYSSEEPSADFNSDGTVDFFDYLDFADRYAQGC